MLATVGIGRMLRHFRHVGDVIRTNSRSLIPSTAGLGEQIGLGCFASDFRIPDMVASKTAAQLAVEMRIRIVKIPPGEAPEEIRKAWVGLVLPLSGFHPCRKSYAGEVLTGPKTWLAFLAAAISGRLKQQAIYTVVGTPP
jgi:hypothetical protein